MRLLAGTSGYSYKEWKGPFYPEGLPDAQLLRFYAGRLPTVEINNTFYRMPRAEVLAGWAAQVPAGFSFAVKAPQAITHRARLAGAGDAVARLGQAVAALGERLGPCLFQLPPYLRRDLPLLGEFLAQLPATLTAAFEFRHASWADDAVYDALRRRGAALCIADVDGAPEPAIVATADFGYLRLRRTMYDQAALLGWAERISGQPWQQAHAYFKHEDAGQAPRLALGLAAAAAG